jgi:hypothetical protein
MLSAHREMFSKCSLRSRYWADSATPNEPVGVQNRRSQHWAALADTGSVAWGQEVLHDAGSLPDMLCDVAVGQCPVG